MCDVEKKEGPVPQRMHKVLRSIEQFCEQHEGDLAGIGASAALKAMAPYWESHLRDGCAPAIVARDLDDVKALFDMLALQLSASTPVLPVAVAPEQPTEGTTRATLVIGLFYELPDGRIALTSGWTSATGTVSYAFDDEVGLRSIHESLISDWKPRRDLSDFPNARDPRLPRDFDLYYDIKWLSQLRAELPGHDSEDELRELMLKHQIVI